MVKAEKGSVKDVANRMKAKGLQKLRFYCQMCQKQCRDQNGFKCHSQSESHMRQMKIFSDNAGGFLKEYSKDFEQSFLSTLKMRHGTKKVNANNVYQELIADKQHIHMNATHWTTLTEFVQYLGKSGRCVVEENHTDGTGGWHVSYIERDVGILERRENQQKREASDKRAEDALLRRMKVQRIEAAKALDRVGGTLKLEATSILDNNNDKDKQPIKMNMGLGLLASSSKIKNKKSFSTAAGASSTTITGFGDDDDDNDDDDEGDYKIKSSKKPSNVEKMMEETMTKKTSMKAVDTAAADQATKKRKHDDNNNKARSSSSSDAPDRNQKRTKQEEKKVKEKDKKENSSTKSKSKPDEHWLYRDILVRVISKKLSGGKYFRKKAVVDRVLEDKFTAEVEVLLDDDDNNNNDHGDILRIDQNDLETVIPKILNTTTNKKPKKVRILKGKFRGKKATVDYLDKAKYRADLLLLINKDYQNTNNDDNGNGNGNKEQRLLKNVPYEDFSQIA